MKRLLISLLFLFYLTLPTWAAKDGKFTYSYPETNMLPYNLGYQYSTYDLYSVTEGWEVMYLKDPVTLTYNITSDTTVEVVFDPSYMEIVDIVIPEKVIDPDTNKEYTVTAIGKMAFDDCPKIRSVIMSDAITRIEDYAFNMCDNKILHNIGYIKFSKNLEHIGNYAFKNCHNLTTGHFTEGDQWELTKRNFLQNPTDPVYGYGGRLTGLDNYLLLPASVNYIGKHAFEGCCFEREDNQLNYGLCKVKIPNPNCVIDDYAFAGCEFLELITIGEKLNYDGLKDPNPSTNKKGRIGAYAFANCNLMRLDIPSSIESIGEYAFLNCFKKETAKTSKTRDGRIYFDQMNWFYPRSLFNNEDDFWNNWNIENADHSNMNQTCDEYLDRWHTNTVTIHSDKTEIGSHAFADNPQLKTVIIKGSAGDIGSGAFSNCTLLSSVEIPSDLTRINSGLFMKCTSLKEIDLPKDVTEIGDSAFYKCDKLETINLPSQLKNVSPYTFYECEKLTLSELPDNVRSIGNHAFYGCRNISSFTIPDNVKSIGDYAFAECNRHEFLRTKEWKFGLQKVIIGNGVTSIGAHAFEGCRHLGDIKFGNSVMTIGDYAFRNCMSCPEESHKDPSQLEDTYAPADVQLPKDLETMGIGVFQGCTHLPSITLGEQMKTLPDFAFAYCSNLTSVGNIGNIETANKNVFLGCYSLSDFGSVFDSKDGSILEEDGIFYNQEKTEVISALPNITQAEIPAGVIKIHDGAFANCGALEYVTFPSSLKEIGSRAFENCIGLQSADLINVKMGEFVYAGCTNIETVFLSSDFTQDLQDNWFAGCINMCSIVVDPANSLYSSDEYETMLLSKDGSTLLRAPSGIYELYIPESVTIIGDYACSNCFTLSNVEIPSTVTHIGAHAFENCCLEYKNKYYSGYIGLGSVYFENPAITIGEYAFNNCKNLYCVDWAGEVKPGVTGSIGAYAFNGCENLNPSTSDFYFNIEKSAISTLEPYAFANLSGLEEIKLPETLETIGDHAFDGCESLASVVFPEGLKRIGNSAFKSSGLTSLNLHDNIEEIGDSAFMDCSKLMALKLPSNLKKINPYTFYRCFSGVQFDKKPEENFNLTIEIPNSVKSIGDYAFYGCAVNSQKYHNKTETNPKNYTEMYYFYNYGIASLSIGEGVESIGVHAFDGCTHLIEVNMGNSVTSIGERAFNNCFNDTFLGVRDVEVTLAGNLENKEGLTACPVIWEWTGYTPQPITLPNGLKTLGEGAFNGCKELPSINFPSSSSLETIPDMAFNGCSRFPKIELNEGLKSIGEGAFGGCTSVTEIHIPATLEKGSRVFVDCEKALKVYYYAEKPETFDEGFFSAKVYSDYTAVITAKNALIADLKMTTPWALFHTIEAKDQTLVHSEAELETTNGLRFRILSNTPHPYCEVAGPVSASTSPTIYVVPEQVKNKVNGNDYKVIRIGNDAFENDLMLEGIEIPETVFDIGQEAFNGCKNLKEINLPKGVTNIGERAFANCYGLTFFEVPPLVTKLNPEVLKDCRGLYSIRMHDNIEELCRGALMDCRHLRAFERSENWKLRIIDDYALKNCIELENINIPEGVEKIGKEAMYYCQKLNTVSLPLSLKEIGENAFDDCEVLTTIKVYTEEIPKILGGANLTEPHCKIYVQAKCLADFRDLWKVHEHRIEPGITIVQPSEEEMPEYIPGNTFKITESRLLDGQTMAWTAFNNTVATSDPANDGTILLRGVGLTHIKVETNQKFYHECDLKVYPQSADANWDGRFDVADAVNIANYVVLNRPGLANWWQTGRRDFKTEADWSSFYNRGADVNKDGDISFADASAAVKIIFNAPKQSSPAASPETRASSENADDALVIGLTPSTTPRGVSFPIGLENSVEYVALQADISVPEGMVLKEVTAGNRLNGHSLTSQRIDDQTIRVVLFDFNNSAFATSGEPLFNLLIEGDNVSADDIELSGIYASDSASTSFELTSRIGWLSSVATIPTVDFSVVSTVDGIMIGNAAGKAVTICMVDGRVINSFVAASDSETVSLSKGIYIVSVEGNAIKIAVN